MAKHEKNLNGQLKQDKGFDKSGSAKHGSAQNAGHDSGKNIPSREESSRDKSAKIGKHEGDHANYDSNKKNNKW